MLDPQADILLCCSPTDMRKSFRGLVSSVKRLLEESPLSGGYFVFINRRKTMMKVLYYEPGGYCIWAKRLDAGQYNYPSSDSSKMSLTRAQLQAIIDGIQYHEIKRFKRHVC